MSNTINKLRIDQKKCIGCGLCTKLCPDYFILSPNCKAQVIKIPKSTKIVEAAISSCPTKAITTD